jgi:hypothetical protein
VGPQTLGSDSDRNRKWNVILARYEHGNRDPPELVQKVLEKARRRETALKKFMTTLNIWRVSAVK